MVSTRKARKAGESREAGTRPGGSKSPGAKPSKEAEGERPGTGALCPDAQADGVPCFELGRDCAQCEEATRKE